MSVPPRGIASVVLFALSGCHRDPPPPDPHAPRRLTAHHTTAPIALDGRTDEPDWSRAASTGPLVDTMTGAGAGRRNSRGAVRALWDEQNLYVAFEIEDHDLMDVATGTDPHLWEQDCAEVMLDPDGDSRNYFEIQVSPGNHLFDTRYDTPRIPRPFGDVAWSSGVRSGVGVRGTINRDSDRDEGYTVEMAIPVSALNGTVPPADGTTWRANFYLMDMRHAVTGNGQAFAGWSPPLVGDFHVPARFGTIVFAP